MNDTWVVEFTLFGADQEQAEDLTDVVATVLGMTGIGYTGCTYPAREEPAE